VTDAQTVPARQLAQERLVNFEWELRVQSLRLQVMEAQLAQESKLADVGDLNVQVQLAHLQIAEKTLAEMQAKYRLAAEHHERDLKQAAANLEVKAQSSDDPLERFRARRTAELLVLEAQVTRYEQALATSPFPSLDEERILADHAAADFARIKELLDDGRVSRLDAIRLNNDFRRIGPERDRLLRNEMATAEAHLQYYENALTNVEIELIQDSLHESFEQDLIRERLPRARRGQGEALLTELERKHRALLVRSRAALEKLSDRAAHTLQQVMRRLSILDEEYGFIRTHIFWVRDQEPIGPATLAQAARDMNRLIKGLPR
jgi:potassium efflux system protein